MTTFRSHPTARGVWEAQQFRSRGPEPMRNLRQELVTLKMGWTETRLTYFNRGSGIARELEELGGHKDKQKIVTSLLPSLPPK